MAEKKTKKAQRGTKQVDYRFRGTDTIGSLAAETDRYLKEGFIDPGFVTALKDTNDQRSIVVGRTGSGKTALLLQIEEGSERVRRTDPLAVAIDYLRDQTEIPQFISLGVNFDPFFRFLWRHILALDVLRIWQGDRSTPFSEIRDKLTRKVAIGSKAKRKYEVLDHLEKWSGGQLRTAEDQTKRLIETFDKEIKATAGWKELGLSFKNSRQSKPSPGEPLIEPSEEFRSGIQRVVSQLGAERAGTLFEFLKTDVLTDRLKPYFIVIDHLDKAWVDSAYAYDLIDALIEVVGEFAEVPNVKVVVAIRQDIVDALKALKKKGRQWEKHENLFLRLYWSDEQLVALADKRLKLLLKDGYGGPISLANLLPEPSKTIQNPVAYVLARTLQRPRDLIAFINACVRVAGSRRKQSISWDVIKEAELEYSRDRLEALVGEWSSVYPGLEVICEAFRGQRGPFTITKLDDDLLNPILTEGERLASGGTNEQGPVPLAVAAFHLMGEPYEAIWSLLATALYQVGFLGGKPSAQDAFVFASKSPRPMNLTIAADTPLKVHPMFCRALGIDAVHQEE